MKGACTGRHCRLYIPIPRLPPLPIARCPLPVSPRPPVRPRHTLPTSTQPPPPSPSPHSAYTHRSASSQPPSAGCPVDCCCIEHRLCTSVRTLDLSQPCALTCCPLWAPLACPHALTLSLQHHHPYAVHTWSASWHPPALSPNTARPPLHHPPLSPKSAHRLRCAGRPLPAHSLGRLSL